MSPEIISLIGIFIGLAIFIILAVKGWNIFVVTMLAGAVTAVFGGLNPIDVLASQYAVGFTNFWVPFFIIFIGGSVFAVLMQESMAADRIAQSLSGLCHKPKNKRMQKFLAVLTLPMINGVLTYGGVNSFVVVFLVVAIARQLFEGLDIPWKMYGCASLGSATFTCGMLPGSPSTINLVPMGYLGTTPTSGALLGVLATILCITLGCIFIYSELCKAEKKGEGFMPTGKRISEVMLTIPDIPQYPILQCLAPCIILLVTMNVLQLGTTLSLFLACLSVAILFFKPLKGKAKNAVTTGVTQGVTTLALVCAASGYGAVVGAVPGYTFVIDALKHIPGPAALQVVVAVNVAAGITGTSQAGLAVALGNLSEHFLGLGIPADALHRLAAASSVGLDTLPHSVGVINACGVSRLTHREIYYYFFVITVCITIVCSLFIALLISLGIGV